MSHKNNGGTLCDRDFVSHAWFLQAVRPVFSLPFTWNQKEAGLNVYLDPPNEKPGNIIFFLKTLIRKTISLDICFFLTPLTILRPRSKTQKVSPLVSSVWFLMEGNWRTAASPASTTFRRNALLTWYSAPPWWHASPFCWTKRIQGNGGWLWRQMWNGGCFQICQHQIRTWQRGHVWDWN